MITYTFLIFNLYLFIYFEILFIYFFTIGHLLILGVRPTFDNLGSV